MKKYRDIKAGSNFDLSVSEPKEEKHHSIELLENQSDINLDESILTSAEVNAEVVSQIQADLEAKVQKILDQLTILANNKYAKGQHMYDYQLVRLTEG